jgi:hypothetical protein
VLLDDETFDAEQIVVGPSFAQVDVINVSRWG